MTGSAATSTWPPSVTGTTKRASSSTAFATSARRRNTTSESISPAGPPSDVRRVRTSLFSKKNIFSRRWRSTVAGVVAGERASTGLNFILLCCYLILLVLPSQIVFGQAAEESEKFRKLQTSYTIDPNDPCWHERDPAVGDPRPLAPGEMFYGEISANNTHLHEFGIPWSNVELLNKPDSERKVIINLEPCEGVVYLFIRKTRRCYPNPYPCMDHLWNPEKSGMIPTRADCPWTHFVSNIDGTRDGAPTMFELPLTSTNYYISVYAKTKAAYTLVALHNIDRFPRPSGMGKLQAEQTNLPLEIKLSWDAAYLNPASPIDPQTLEPVKKVTKYDIYSALLLDDDKRTNSDVFLSSDKIMNTVCGLTNNTDRPFNSTQHDSCVGGKCEAIVHGIITGKRYVFNVVAHSDGGYASAYAGLILQTDWTVKRREGDDDSLIAAAGVMLGATLAFVVTMYCWMVNWY